MKPIKPTPYNLLTKTIDIDYWKGKFMEELKKDLNEIDLTKSSQNRSDKFNRME